MKNFWRSLLAPAICAAGLTGLASLANAGGYLNILQSASSAGEAGAGATALGEDAATIWYNPAGMVLTKQPELLLTGGLTFPSISFRNQGSTDAAGLPIGGNSFTNPMDALLPSVFALSPIDNQ